MPRRRPAVHIRASVDTPRWTALPAAEQARCARLAREYAETVVLAWRVRQQRLYLGRGQKQVAAALGRATRAVSDFEAGRTRLDLPTALGLLRTLVPATENESQRDQTLGFGVQQRSPAERLLLLLKDLLDDGPPVQDKPLYELANSAARAQLLAAAARAPRPRRLELDARALPSVRDYLEQLFGEDEGSSYWLYADPSWVTGKFRKPHRRAASE